MTPTALVPRPWSCDTLAVHADHSACGGTVLAKNSDRPARECQPVRHLGSRQGGGKIRLAYLDIDDVAETIPHLGSSPYWCWGHESGVNAHGVGIGNEAIFTRDLANNATRHRHGETVQPGILGMELLRLALERADSAHAAVDVMTSLVERFGQWGAGTRATDVAGAAYDNSYLVADSDEIWVLETSGRRWAAKRVEQPTWALSNEATLRDDWTECAADLQDAARDSGWCSSAGRVDFALAVTDPQVPLQLSHIRLQRSRTLLQQFLDHGTIGLEQVRTLLRDHYEDSFLQGPKFNAARPDFLTLCMHESPAGFTWGNTAASTIMVLPNDATPVMWWAPVTPCTSVYLPIVPHGSRLPGILSRSGTARGTGPNPESSDPDGYAEDSLWWRFQRLLEIVNGDQLGGTYQDRQPIVRSVLDQLQAHFVEEADALAVTNADGNEWSALTHSSVERAIAAADGLIARFA